jgi:hypothetical protein
MKNRYVKIFILGIVFIVVSCAWTIQSDSMLWHYFYAFLDGPVCVRTISQKIGVAAEYSAIVRYAEKSVHPGMSREDVHAALRKIAPVDWYNGNPEEIMIQMCSSPLNYLVFWAYYTPDGKLMKMERDDYP